MTFKKLSRFVVVGGVNTLIDFGLFALLANALGSPQVLANVCSVAIAMTCSFFLNHRFVFKSDRRKRETAPKFFLVSIFNGFVVQGAIIWVLTSVDSLQELVGQHWLNLLVKCCAVGIAMCSNFIFYNIVFKKKEE